LEDMTSELFRGWIDASRDGPRPWPVDALGSALQPVPRVIDLNAPEHDAEPEPALWG
jgi:hypothetical protein